MSGFLVSIAANKKGMFSIAVLQTRRNSLFHIPFITPHNEKHEMFVIKFRKILCENTIIFNKQGVGRQRDVYSISVVRNTLKKFVLIDSIAFRYRRIYMGEGIKAVRRISFHINSRIAILIQRIYECNGNVGSTNSMFAAKNNYFFTEM